jgi:uncharacterized heparinase superfamily protein
MRGLNWKSPLEAGIRLISWAYTFLLLQAAPQAARRFHHVLGQTIYQHQYFIRTLYAKHSSANNHLIGEMAGLYVAAVCWPWYRESHTWRALVRRELCEEITRQVEADGVGKERATEYQVWGQTPAEVPLAPIPTPGDGLHAFPQGGYYVLAANRGSDDEMVVVFDAGPLGFDPLYAHGHADALSFWLSYGGREFLIDPGTFCYYTHEAWRAYFRSTAAHNTLRIDGTDQSVPGGRFLWCHTAHCRAEHVEDTQDYVAVDGYHDGYQRLADPVIHRRGLRLQKKSGTLVITDRLECQGSHDVEVFFHFSEQCQVWQVGGNSFEALNGTKRLCLHLDAQLHPTLYRGAEQPISGWVSRTFGVKKPAFTLIARVQVAGAAQLRTEVVTL